jgi:hypothetical protein
MNKKHMIMDINPEISTYMKREVSDSQPAQIELHTHWEEWNGTKFYSTSVCDSKEHKRDDSVFKKLIESVMFYGVPENELLYKHKRMVNKYRETGYQVINEKCSPEMQDELDRINFEIDNFEKLLEEIKIPDKIV